MIGTIPNEAFTLCAESSYRLVWQRSQVGDIVLIEAQEEDQDKFWSDLRCKIQKKYQQDAANYYAVVLPYGIYVQDPKQFNLQLKQVANEALMQLIFIIPVVTEIISLLIETQLVSEQVSYGVYLEDTEEEAIKQYEVLLPSMIIIPEEHFKVNSKGYPILKSEQIRRKYETLYRRDQITMLYQCKLMEQKIEYIRYVQKHVRKTNYLVDPLQPQSKDLTSAVYEIFEKDQNKYRQYARAIQSAIQENEIGRILVVGPGYNGPLVDIVYEQIEGKDIEIVAIEKNRKCRQSLTDRNGQKWNNQVQLIFEDVRKVADLKADMVVSEMLGSIGCNELSPEVLQSFQNPNLIMIPQRYQSYLMPVYSPFLEKPPLYQPYLVNFAMHNQGQWQKLFEFHHPSDPEFNQSREIFNSQPINGFKGVFVSNLYKNVRIGNHPQMLKEEYCDSWWELVFPVALTRRQDWRFQRCNNGKTVWYQWQGDEEYGEDYQMTM